MFVVTRGNLIPGSVGNKREIAESGIRSIPSLLLYLPKFGEEGTAVHTVLEFWESGFPVPELQGLECCKEKKSKNRRFSLI